VDVPTGNKQEGLELTYGRLGRDSWQHPVG